MKKKIRLLLTLPFFLITFSGNAQVDKGHIQIGGLLNASFGHNKMEDNRASYDSVLNTKETVATAMPTAGFGIGRNFIIGAGIGYSYSKNNAKNLFDDGVSGETTTQTRSIVYKLFARKCIPFNVKSGIYAELGGSYSSSRQITDMTGDLRQKNKFSSTSVYLVPGIYYKINSRLCLDVQLGGFVYTDVKNAPLHMKKQKAIEFTFPASIGIGVQVTL